jgi:hypothetical protein
MAVAVSLDDETQDARTRQAAARGVRRIVEFQLFFMV